MPMTSLAEPSGRYLSLAEREEIACGLAAKDSIRVIAARLGREPSTISREINRNRGIGKNWVYRASVAQSRADEKSARPKPSKLAEHAALQEYVQAGLLQRWSPQQISLRLREEFTDRPEMRVSHETIYRSLYVQGRGQLRRELAACLRTGRALRRPQRRPDRRQTRIKDMVMISERPAEVADRAVPGHWEGDLIIGRNSGSAIGTLVERATRYVLLLHLPHRHGAEEVQHAMLDAIGKLPDHLWRSLTWDQGIEMANHRKITIAADLPIYFCDPASPWQRGSNENTNGLLRQYFPKSTDLSVHTEEDLDRVAAELNGRPRKTLNWKTPAEALNDLLLNPYPKPGVATTP
ncbi:MAG: IS30 family transposase [Hamadaea sp.]|nr:IS30 family transposase [Hamadaea sp.]